MTEVVGRVAALWRYPVKSMQGENLERAVLDRAGIPGDRAFGVRDIERGTVLSAKREGRLLMAAARLGRRDGDDAGAHGAHMVPTVEVPGSRSLSEWLGRPVELVRAPPWQRSTYENLDDPFGESDGPLHEYQGPPGSFHDDHPVHLVTTASLGPWDVRRFRPNVVVDTGEVGGRPEDSWSGRRLRIGTAQAQVDKPTSRCVMVTHRQPGVERDAEVLRTLGREHAFRLGVYLRVVTPGEVAVGDTVALD